ncbi:C40 family peptidase [Allosalinactinospora lopnorensis]|uniref:C40 family peptidase n=1 Tax=Allosalinactinospora lopnorensis TaxID=1352348 RepID=UPI0006983365|nr:NlpC/P60 family protein [Allosalinactinospora lopnorensis]
MKKWWLAAAVVFLLFLGSCGAPALVLIARSSSSSSSDGTPVSVEGIPDTLLDAYQQAADQAEERFPKCSGLTWNILAGIGRIESTHLMHLEGYEVDANGDVSPPFYGPRLDGSLENTAVITDTDNGKWDGDTEYDRAVGPMQFLPSSWAIYKQDGNGNGATNPNNIYDATLTAAAHLCGETERDLADREQLREALYRYNNSQSYVEDVLRWSDSYASRSHSGARGENSASGNAIVDAGEEWLGTPYLYGGACNLPGRDRCDCSSLTRYAYRHGAEIELPRTTYEQVQLPQHDERFVAIPADRISDLQPGDLLFFGSDPPWGIGHVGIYISDTLMLEAPRTGLKVRHYEGWQTRGQYYGAVGLR